jgi:hypothetical protein
MDRTKTPKLTSLVVDHTSRAWSNAGHISANATRPRVAQVATPLGRAKPAVALRPSTAESGDMEMGAKPGAERLLASA